MTTGQSIHEWGIFIFSKGVCFFFIKKNLICLFVYFSVCVCFAWMCICTTCVLTQRSEVGVGSPDTGVIDSCKLPHVCQALNPGPLEE